MNDIRLSGKIVEMEVHEKNNKRVKVILEKFFFIDNDGEDKNEYFLVELFLPNKEKMPKLEVNGNYEIIGNLASNYSYITERIDDTITIYVDQIERVVRD